MIITSIIIQKKNKDKYNIYVDNNYCFSADYEDIIEFDIKADQYVDDEQLKNLIYKCQYKKALNKALNFLARRFMSEYEIKGKLLSSGYNEEIIETVIKKLKELNYVDDERFSKQWVEDRKLMKPIGMKRLEAELQNKGISRELIKNTLDESGCDDLETAVYLIGKKLGNNKVGCGDKTTSSKLYRYLLYKGIGYETARKAISRYLNIDNYNE